MTGALILDLGQSEVALQFQSTPLARTYADLGTLTYGDMDGYTYGMLDQGEGIRLVMQGAEMPLLLGFPSPAGIYENLTGLTYADLGTLTYAEMDNL